MSLFTKNRPRVWSIFLFAAVMAAFALPAFSQQVDTAWVRRYNGPGNGDDRAVAIAVDSIGNVYVTGSSFDSTSGYDFCTIKYLPNGDTAWVRSYNGPANDTDLARALVLDANSNVYVTGVSQGDITTIKYGLTGDTLWVRRLSTSLNGNRSIYGGYALGLDGRGNLYVTGQQWDLESWLWFLIKYDTAGNLLWSRPVDLTLKTRFGLALDTSGNVYIAAGSEVVKYNPQGDRIWGRALAGEASTMALDMGGNVYVTGVVAGSPGYTTVKLDTSGSQLWSRLYSTCQGGSAIPLGLVVDRQNSIYITGQLWYCEDFMGITVKYDSSGNLLWDKGHFVMSKGNAIAVDTSGNSFVAGIGSSLPFATIKYDSNGNQLWLKGTLCGNANAVALDASGNIDVTGVCFGGGTGLDFNTIKYSPLPQLKGDLNLDGTLSAADVVAAVNCTFLGQPPPAAPMAADLNCDGKVTPADVVILLYMVFLSAPAPC